MGLHGSPRDRRSAAGRSTSAKNEPGGDDEQRRLDDEPPEALVVRVQQRQPVGLDDRPDRGPPTHGQRAEHARPRGRESCGSRRQRIRVCAAVFPPSPPSRRRVTGRRPAAAVRPRVRRGEAAGGTRRRRRRGGAAPGRRTAAAGDAPRGRFARRTRQASANGRGRVALDLAQPVANGAPPEREHDREHGEHRQRVGVEPRREQRPAALGEPVGIVLDRNQSAVAPNDGQPEPRLSVSRSRGAPSRRCCRARAAAPRRRSPFAWARMSRQATAARRERRQRAGCPQAGTGSTAPSAPPAA